MESATSAAVEGVEVCLFRATKDSHRFTQNQKVFVAHDYGNCLDIWHRWRGKGRFVRGRIDAASPLIGVIRTIEVDAEFAKRIRGEQ